MSTRKFKIIQTFYVMLITLGLIAWVTQESIENYSQQQFHQHSPLYSLNVAEWQFGKTLRDKLEQPIDQISLYGQQLNQTSLAWLNSPSPKTTIAAVVTTPSKAVKPQTTKPVESSPDPAPPEPPHPVATNDEAIVLLSPADKVLLAGDSMMEGLVAFISRDLKKNYNLETVNLSKKSTGLSFPSNFDWPQTIETQIEQNRDVKVLVVFLGPNDPWDIGLKGGKLLRFKSEDWEALYRSRIQRIMQVAQAHQVTVIWMGLPNMKTPKLNDGVHYLNQLFESEMNLYQQIYIPTVELLGNPEGQYTKFIVVPDQGSVSVRAEDGIHFSPRGQRMLAQSVTRLIGLKIEETPQ